MNEELRSVGRIGAAGAMDDYGSAQEHSPPPPKSPPVPRAPAAAVDDQRSRPSEQAIRLAMYRINAHLAAVDRALSLQVDPESGQTVAQIRDALSGEILQQIPTEDPVQLERMLARWSHGGNVLMDLEA
jgi:uncharacterized FlaG/YvyC family protein